MQRNVKPGSYDDGDDNTDDSLYGNEESITEWLNDHTAPGQSTSSPQQGAGHSPAGTHSSASAAASGANGASDSLLTRRASLSSNSTGGAEHSNHSIQPSYGQAQALEEVDLEGNQASGGAVSSNAVHHIPSNGSGSGVSPGSPHVVMKSGAVNNNTTVRKRSAIV